MNPELDIQIDVSGYKYLRGDCFGLYIHDLSMPRGTVGPQLYSKELNLFKKCHFDAINLQGGIFHRCIFMGCKFTNCNFAQVNFSNCDFDRDTLFHECNLLDSRFSMDVGTIPKGLWFSGPDSRGKNVFTWYYGGIRYFNFENKSFTSVPELLMEFKGAYGHECCQRMKFLNVLANSGYEEEKEE